SVSNYLLISLAIADLMVAILVMPVCALKHMSKSWWLGVHLCDLWICLDVLCCTASILHLVGIALDRYWAVTNVKYVRSQSASRICLVIALTWLISAVISVPARFYPSRDSRSISVDNCSINEEPGYTAFSTIGAFYLPMLFILAIYLAIYKAVKRRIRKKGFKQVSINAIGLSTPSCSGVSAGSGGSVGILSSFRSGENARLNSFPKSAQRLKLFKRQTETSIDSPDASTGSAQPVPTTGNRPVVDENRDYRRRSRVAQARERRAARTLAVVTGCFLICWLPFFVHASFCPFNHAVCDSFLSETGHAVIQWLGYANSLLNPIIYTVFSPDFRHAFSKILFGRNHRLRRR
uniref:G_PROTEIN_RECEP_F1_2 domain-containing protein n=1 Tax=Macrostomum lignano TaxID=282301 RepID=A0A1I8HAN9_9PLAT